MSAHDDEPLSPDLAALVTAARAHVRPPAPGKDAVRARLERSIAGGAGGSGGDGSGGDGSGGDGSGTGGSGAGAGGAGAGGAGAGAGGSGAGAASSFARWAAVFLGGAAVGGAVVYGVFPRQVVERVTVVEAVPAVSAVSAVPASPLVSIPRVEHPVAAASVSTSAPALRAPAPSDSLEAERVLLDPARTALGRRDGASALAAVAQHEKQYPRGLLTEEREAIAVQALVQVGRTDEARTRGNRFLERYPGSVLVPAVRAAIEPPR